MFFDKAVFSQLFFDLAEIAFGSGNVQSVGDGFQMFDLRLCFRQLLNKRLFRPFQLAITVKVFFAFSEGVKAGSSGTVISSFV